ncbi:hypothetical protein [Streptomyces tendae]|uniref:Uncharacterized protein n=1 Tax=Streptomyces tendae TaxID=1932 RepID=A0ABW7RSR8_STRTE
MSSTEPVTRESDPSSEIPIPRWAVGVFPLSVLVAVTWGPAQASVLCGVAAVAVLYATSRKPASWHLAAGTVVCAAGVLLQGSSYYLVVRDGSFGSVGQLALIYFLGLHVFLRGRQVRRAAQLDLSGLRRHRAEHGLLTPDEPLGEPRPGRRWIPLGAMGVLGAVVCGLGSLSFCMAVLGTRDIVTTDDHPWWGPLAIVVLLGETVVLIGMGNTILRTGARYYDTVISSPDDGTSCTCAPSATTTGWRARTASPWWAPGWPPPSARARARRSASRPPSRGPVRWSVWGIPGSGCPGPGPGGCTCRATTGRRPSAP